VQRLRVQDAGVDVELRNGVLEFVGDVDELRAGLREQADAGVS
jgi:predicted RNA-binding protein associated with RNAse of E/G family